MIASPWSPLATSLLGVFVALGAVGNGLFHLLIYKVNRGLSPSERIPHSLYWGGWNRLRDLYRSFYPRSSLWSVTLALAIAALFFAVVAASVLWWQYAAGK